MSKGSLDISQNSEQSERETAGSQNYSVQKNMEVKGTPFRVIVLDTGKAFVALGANRLTEELESEEKAIEKIHGKDWELVMSLIILVCHQLTSKTKEA